MYLTLAMRDLFEQRGHMVWTLPGVFSSVECEAIIGRMEALGPSLAPVTTASGPVIRTDIRTNDRVMFDDRDLADTVFHRIAHGLPAELAGRSLVGLNERFRGYRYTAGQAFRPHLDGVVQLEGRSSELTLVVYLNEDCEGGETRFLSDPIVSIVPKQGMALLFAHRLLHEGTEVRSGVKYVLRSDVMYRQA
jgi:prolyl 4-hydroxylase